MDPKDGWDKTWAYLVELGKNIEYYPTGTGAMMKELGEGSRDMIASHLGWDLNPRILGVVPKEAEVGTLEGFHWVTDAQYWAIPKGVSERQAGGAAEDDRLHAEQAGAGDDLRQGLFLSRPGGEGRAAVDGAEGQPGRDQLRITAPFYDKLIAEVPSEVPLPADKLVYAFQRWDQQVGARVGK